MDDNNVKPALAFGSERYEGKPATVGGKSCLIPAISLGALKRLRDPVRKILDEKATEEKAQDTTVSVIFAALKRNYPEITLDFVAEEIIDLSNSRQLLNLVLNASGYVKSAAPGNEPALTNTEASDPGTENVGSSVASTM